MMQLRVLLLCVLTSLNIYETKAYTDFDYLVLRQYWPFTSCKFPGNNTCSVPENINNWVIHGLWPNYYVPRSSNYGPSFCNVSDEFNLGLVKPLMTELTTHWPNLYDDTPLDSLWQHEWDKHGTCALGVDGINNQMDYFNSTLMLRTKYDFGHILSSNYIEPKTKESSYLLGEFLGAFINDLNVKPATACFLDETTNKQYIGEMHICFNKKFVLIDCDFKPTRIKRNVVDGKGEIECNETIPIYYPSR